MRSSFPKPLASAITQTINQLGIGVKIKEHEALDAWTQIVGEQISKVAIAETIRDGKLFVKVAHSTWRNELMFLKHDLIVRINKRMNQNIVKDIIFR